LYRNIKNEKGVVSLEVGGKVICPYCGYVQDLTVRIQGRVGSEIFECGWTEDFKGCGLEFVLAWTVTVECKARKIEGEAEKPPKQKKQVAPSGDWDMQLAEAKTS
jgi:hypothetical protein